MLATITIIICYISFIICLTLDMVKPSKTWLIWAIIMMLNVVNLSAIKDSTEINEKLDILITAQQEIGE